MSNAFDFITKYPAGAPKINFLCCGGGYTFSLLLGVPGASSVMNAVLCPYDTFEVSRLLGGANVDKFVSEAFVKLALDRLSHIRPDIVHVVITAAYQSNRYRRGENQAFFGIQYDNILNIDHITFGKESEETHKLKSLEDIHCTRIVCESILLTRVLKNLTEFVDELVKTQNLLAGR